MGFINTPQFPLKNKKKHEKNQHKRNAHEDLAFNVGNGDPLLRRMEAEIGDHELALDVARFVALLWLSRAGKGCHNFVVLFLLASGCQVLQGVAFSSNHLVFLQQHTQ